MSTATARATGALLRAEGVVRTSTHDVEVDLTLQAGVVTGLIGPNGAGKTATIAALLGLLRFHTGACLDARGQRLPRATHERGLAWVPAVASLLPRRRVEEQLTAFLGERAPLLQRAEGPTAAVAHVLRALDLDGLAERRPHQLSGGQAQRVAIARAVLRGPVVLLDEPTAAQDVQHAAGVRALVREHTAAGGAALLVAHQPIDALLVADRLVVLEHGRVVQTGAPSDLAASPATPYVAAVAGASVLRGEVRDAVLRTDTGLELVVADAVADGPVTAVVRPSAITLHREAPPASSARNVLPGTVAGVDDREGRVAVTVAVDDTDATLVAHVTHASARDLALAIGARVHASCKANEVDVHGQDA